MGEPKFRAMETSAIRRENKTEKRELQGKLKIWIVEDQHFPKIILLNAVKTNFGEFFENFKNGEGVFLVDNFADAQKILESEDLKNNIILLDNRLPETRSPKSKLESSTKDADLKEFDPSAFEIYEDDLEHLGNTAVDGYALIEQFKSKGATVIGTSSMDEDEIHSKGLGMPDFQIGKKFSEAKEGLAGIKETILDRMEA